ncbi:MAG: hypothetical protein PHP54_01975 [Clostridia bacterium]|nr:hypothetical protein [Clostridia bacterium]
MKKVNKKTIFIIISILVVLLISWIVYIIISESNKFKFDSVYDITDLESVLQYYNIEKISEQVDTSSNTNKVYAIYLYAKYPYNTYTDNKTNEAFFMESSEQIARVCGYKNVLVVDEEKALKVGIKSVASKFYKVIINDDENYFSTLKTNLELNGMSEISGKKYTINSNQLNSVIKAGFKSNVNFGTKESTFDYYDIYFEEGIEVKNVAGEIFNLVFTSKYNDDIIEGLGTKATIEEIKAKLGEPLYTNNTNTILGYKADSYYIYFVNGQVSIYPIKKFDTTEFAKYITEFQTNKSAQVLVNNVSELWKDYDYFNNGSKYIELTYTLKGVKIAFNSGESDGITLYNNYNGKVTNEVEYAQIINGSASKPQYIYIKNSNLTLENEIKRSEGIHNTEKSLKEFNYRDANRKAYGQKEDLNKPSNEFRRKSSKYFVVSDQTTKHIISLNNTNPNSQLMNVGTLIWIDNDNLAYSVPNNGIYLYNATNRTTKELIKGNDEFIIKNYENNTLVYDDKSIECNI